MKSQISNLIIDIALKYSVEYNIQNKILEVNYKENTLLDNFKNKIKEFENNDILAGYKIYNFKGVGNVKKYFEKFSSQNLNINFELSSKNFLYLDDNKEKYNIIMGDLTLLKSKKSKIDLKGIKKLLNNETINFKYLEELELFAYYILKSLFILKDEGLLVFAVPFSFFTEDKYYEIRKILSSLGEILEIVSFEDEILNNKKEGTLYFIYKKGKSLLKKSKVSLLKNGVYLKRRFNKNPNATINLKKDFTSYKITKERFNKPSEKFWNIYEKKETIFEDSVKITEIFDVSTGMFSGYDKAFFLNRTEERKLTNFEKNFIIDIVKTRTLFMNNNIINNEDLFEIERYIYIPKNAFSSEEDLKEKAPNIYNIIVKNKDLLINRHGTSSFIDWYEWISTNKKEVFTNNKDKLFFPSQTRKKGLKVKYVYDKEQSIFADSSLITFTFKDRNISKEARKYYISYLTSKDFSDILYQNVPCNGTLQSFSQKYISNMKIPKKVF